MKKFTAGSGRAQLTFTWEPHGQDWSIHIGGGAHHLGAVAMAGRGPDGRLFQGALCLPPHREDDLALRAARTLHNALGSTVCVSAGVHLDDISQEEIAEVLRVADEGVQRLISQLRE
jgi:hypothetical protein